MESDGFRTLIDTTEAKVDGRQRYNMHERQVRTIGDKCERPPGGCPNRVSEYASRRRAPAYSDIIGGPPPVIFIASMIVHGGVTYICRARDRIAVSPGLGTL